MPKALAILIVFLLIGEPVFSQSRHQVDSLVLVVCKTSNSKDIIKSRSANKIISYGNKLLPLLSGFFKDTTLTIVQSYCQGRYLNKGEIAIILADHIELMPYSQLTGIQNCLLEMCPNNPNGIEFYLNSIKHDGIGLFYKRYTDWLNSADRKKWPPYTKQAARFKYE